MLYIYYMILDYKVLELHGKPVVEKAILKPPFSLPTNMSNDACFVYVLEGVNKIMSPIDTEKINETESVLLRCGNYLGQVSEGSGSNYSAVAIHFYPEVLSKIYNNKLPDFLRNNGEDSNRSIAKFKSSLLFEKYVEGMLFYFENPELVTEELLELKLKELLLLLHNSNESGKIQEIFYNLFNPSKVGFRQVIETNLYNDLTLEELSQLTNKSLSTFKREFKRLYNASPASYLRLKKLEKAKGLLMVSEDSISNVAYDSGFNDLSHFSKLFKVEYGITPKEYKIKNQSKL